MSEVSIFLNNEDKKVAIPYSEVVITRRLYRDGTSEYMINKNPVRLQDVIFLLAKAHFGQKSYSVVGQGMIDAVLNASIADRKSFFYEATGVKQFQIKKDISLNKLASTKQNLQQVEITLQELEPHLKSLTRMVKRLEQREQLEKELHEVQRRYYECRWSDLVYKLTRFEGIYKERELEKSSLEKELSLSEADLKELEEGETRGTVFDALQAEYQKLLNKKNTALRELASIKGKLDVQYQKVGKMNVVWLGKRADEIEQRMVELKAEHRQQKEKLTSLETKSNELQKIRVDVEDQIRNLQIRINEMQMKVREYAEFSEEELNSELGVLYHAQKNLIFSLENAHDFSEIKNIKDEAQNIMKRLEALYDKVKRSSRDVQSKEMITWQQELNNFLQEKNSLLSELTESQSTIRMLQQRIEYADSETKKLESEKKRITAEIAAASSDTQQEHDALLATLQQEKQKLEEQLLEHDASASKVKAHIDAFNQREEEKRLKMIHLQRNVSSKQNELASKVSEVNAINIELAKLQVHREELERDVVLELGDLDVLTTVKESELDMRAVEALVPKIQKLKHKLEFIGGIDEEAVGEYNEVKERYEFLSTQSRDLHEAGETLEKIVHELELKISKQFQEEFTKISEKFEKYFKILFGGGNASMVRVMEEDVEASQEVLDENGNQVNNEALIAEDSNRSVEREKKKKPKKIFVGIDMNASPPGKKVKNIASLSGGEKALTSIALICAIIANNPSPFVVLDEVDAALDEANSEKFADIVEELAHRTQFIVITHNRATMKRSHILYGVTSGRDGVSQLLSIKLEVAERIAKR